MPTMSFISFIYCPPCSLIWGKEKRLLLLRLSGYGLRRRRRSGINKRVKNDSDILLPRLNLEDFMRRTAVERQGRKPQEYAHISRISDEVFWQSGKRKNSRFNWGSNSIEAVDGGLNGKSDNIL